MASHDDDAGQTVAVDGTRLKISNLDKVLYPQTGTTKGDVISYYHRVGSIMVPHLSGRPVTRKRWVHGVGTAPEPGSVFFQKNLDPSSTPDWVRRFPISHHDRTNRYPVADNLATLVWFAQLASLEIHVPQWRFDTDGTPQNPDRLILDLDPGTGVGLPECAQVARWARELLDGIGYTLYPVTSGSKGIHLYARLDQTLTSQQASSVAKEIAETLERQHPHLVTSQMGKQHRSGKVFIDWSQNNANKTTISPYSLRGTARPMVAAPRRWDELDDDLEQLDLWQLLERVTDGEELLAPLALAPVPEARDRLATYRSKRNPDRTPEPVPDRSGVTNRSATDDHETGSLERDDAPAFVIQEHHARRLHYDFRLERDGVLVSWAVPKGVPTGSQNNHLAVQTEDHPLEYGSFSGIIPDAQYGGGEVLIFDSGSYELEKWRDGREVIVTLNGTEPGGVGTGCKVALIHTGGHDGQPDNHWLMHLMSGQPSEPTPAAADQLQELRRRAAGDGDLVWDPGGNRQSGRQRSTRPTAHTEESPNQQNPPAAFPAEVQPMLATAIEAGKLRASAEWSYEMKWDGVRAGCYLAGGRARILSRSGRDVTGTYPEIAAALADLNLEQSILDGEIVAPDENGRPSFARLQQRMNLAQPAEITRARTSIPVQLVLFDLLLRDGRSWIKQPYQQRRDELEQITAGTDETRLAEAVSRIQVPPVFDGDLSAALAASQALGLEGVVAKRRSSIYQPGSRGRTWLKIKNIRTQEVVIGGWRTGRGDRSDTVGSLLMAVPDSDTTTDSPTLNYVGRVGTGFSEVELQQMSERFTELAVDHPQITGVPDIDTRDAHWIEPVLVGEVSYSEWTQDHRLRFPVWRGWRTDKSPSQIRMEA